MNQILSYIMLIFLLLGAVDHVMGNRFGIGESFRQGVMMAGNLLLCMAGFLVLAPMLAHILAPFTAPFFRFIGADPSAIAGILLANDSGGAALAVEIADNQEAGLFHGLIVGAGIGTTQTPCLSQKSEYRQGV